jgi:PAS domain S-box-containing protein
MTDPNSDKINNSTAIARSLAALQTQNAALQAELAQCRRELSDYKRIEAEANLRASEQELRTLAENTADSIFRFDLDGRYLYLNPAAEKNLGYPKSFVLGKSDRELNRPDEAVTFGEHILQTVVETRELVTVEFSIPAHNNGQWLQSHNIPEFDSNGHLTSILVIERDITKLKQTEAALRQSEERFQRIAANMPGIIFQFCIAKDGTRTFPYISPYFETLFGISATAVEKDAELFMNCCHPDDRAFLEASIFETHTHLAPWYWEGRFFSSSRQMIWLEGASKPEPQTNGDVLWDGVLMDVSDRKRHEADRQQLEADRQKAIEALQYSEEQLRAIFDNAPIAIALANTYDYRIVRVNSAHRELIGYSDAELTTMTFGDFTHPEDIASDIKCLQQLIETNQSRFQLEKRYVKKNGDLVWVDLTVALIYDQDGNPRYTLGMVQDITEAKQHEADRQKAEEALRQSEEQFRAFFENSPIALGLATVTDHRMFRSNLEYQNLLGYGEAELSQMSFIEYSHPDDLKLDLMQFSRLLSGELERYQMEKRYFRKTGETIWVDLTVTLIYDNQGEPLYSFATYVDITEAKRLDAERRQTEEALRRSQASLTEAQRIGRMGSWEVDLVMQQETWSEELFYLFGLDPSQSKPSLEQIMQFIHPSDRAMYQQIIEQAFEQGKPHAVDHQVIRADGSSAWFFSQGQVERNAQGQITRLFGTALDITSRKQAEVNLRKSLQEKEVLLKELHHRVKNNLQIISSLLRMQARKVESLQAYSVLQESQNRVQSMALIHEQLYQSSNLAQIDMNEYLHSLVDNLFLSYGTNPQQIAISIETNDAPLILNIAIPCGLIINELVSNSLKYAFPSNESGIITICLASRLNPERMNNQGILSITDNGVGIPATVDWQNSSSLGLRIVRNLVHQLKGDIILLPKAGTAFQITFPIADISDQAVAK